MLAFWVAKDKYLASIVISARECHQTNPELAHVSLLCQTFTAPGNWLPVRLVTTIISRPKRLEKPPEVLCTVSDGDRAILNHPECHLGEKLLVYGNQLANIGAKCATRLPVQMKLQIIGPMYAISITVFKQALKMACNNNTVRWGSIMWISL